VQRNVGSEGGGCAQLTVGKKVSLGTKRSSSAAPGNGTTVAAHGGGEDIVLGLAPLGRHNGEHVTARAGRASLGWRWHLAPAMQRQ
jgi:hypothetical protein